MRYMIIGCKMYGQMQEERRTFSHLSSFIFFSIIISARDFTGIKHCSLHRKFLIDSIYYRKKRFCNSIMCQYVRLNSLLTNLIRISSDITNVIHSTAYIINMYTNKLSICQQVNN